MDEQLVEPFYLAVLLPGRLHLHSSACTCSSNVLPQPFPTAAAAPRFSCLAALIGITAMSGCFVAGKDAGRAYNTWPDMNGGRVGWPQAGPTMLAGSQGGQVSNGGPTAHSACPPGTPCSCAPPA